MSDNPAPWLDLLNSDWHDYLGSGRREDRLDDPLWLDAFLRRWRLDTGRASRDKVVASFRGLRKTLRRLADAFAADRKSERRDWEAVNACLKRSPFIEEAGPARTAVELRRVPLGNPLDAALAAVASSFVETVVRGDSSRIKICGNKDCFWVFYDGSRNRSRRWCEDTCGNLMKVRDFRRRRKKRSRQVGAGGAAGKSRGASHS
ncbi:MAG: hypothetical protein A2Y56_07620 [Candidatus Aminicenantes bacterium RBG_13_63_10]|nr:MAG: hypothetical protein A2Y56_07620 [Candidatus Aminicenantes bacterium RBG_13_63_10]